MAQQQSARLQAVYRDKIAPELIQKFSYKSPMEVPRITKITLNMGVSEAVSDKKIMDNAVGDLTKIAGQKPVVTQTRKAIANFKVPKRVFIEPELPRNQMGKVQKNLLRDRHKALFAGG